MRRSARRRREPTATCRPTPSTWLIRAPMRWSARRRSSSRARRGGSSGTLMRRCAGSTGRRRSTGGATSVAARSRSTGSMRCRTPASASTASSGRKMASADPIARKRRRFWGIVAGIVIADAFTKMLAVDLLVPARLPRGAAFGLDLGENSRWIFTGLTLGALVLLAHLYRTTRAGATPRTIALALVCGGALGNLMDRLKSARGVVDFIDVGIGTLRWPTFNVADMAVSCGAVLLAIVLWREDARHAARAAAASGQDAPVHG